MKIRTKLYYTNDFGRNICEATFLGYGFYYDNQYIVTEEDTNSKGLINSEFVEKKEKGDTFGIGMCIDFDLVYKGESFYFSNNPFFLNKEDVIPYYQYLERKDDTSQYNWLQKTIVKLFPPLSSSLLLVKLPHVRYEREQIYDNIMIIRDKVYKIEKLDITHNSVVAPYKKPDPIDWEECGTVAGYTFDVEPRDCTYLGNNTCVDITGNKIHMNLIEINDGVIRESQPGQEPQTVFDPSEMEAPGLTDNRLVIHPTNMGRLK